ncbi:MAG: hypothetical protein JW860_02550, partial [Sedimentisphaerales bacterium]|nr:hypothetical protein [Sedimentisphaerales bacterium]
MEKKRNSLKVTCEKALLVNVALPDKAIDPLQSLSELESLTEAAGAYVIGHIRQKRSRINPGLYVGKGKAEQIAEIAKVKDANVVIFDNDLSPAQIRCHRQKYYVSKMVYKWLFFNILRYFLLYC